MARAEHVQGRKELPVNRTCWVSTTEPNYDLGQFQIAPKLAALGKGYQDFLRAKAGDPAVKANDIRIFTEEDEADEAAVRVAKLLGLDASELANALLVHTDPEFAPICSDILAKGKIPAYGGFVDPHHSPCWRQWRNQKLKAALTMCAPTWPK